jgi:hypothetical protein
MVGLAMATGGAGAGVVEVWFRRHSCFPTLRSLSVLDLARCLFLTYCYSECADGDDAAHRYRYVGEAIRPARRTASG